MTKVGVLGATGFIGSAVVDALRSREVEYVALPAPRLRTRLRRADEILAEARGHEDVVEDLAERMRGLDAVVNAAGLALPTAPDSDELFGANVLVPALADRAATLVGCRLVHVSSAAVQGSIGVLDESTEVNPFSPYSRSKAAGEQSVNHSEHAVVFRPTSVQGSGREVTHKLVRLSRSRLASVASPGTDPTPQVLVGNVGDAIAFTALSAVAPPKVVLQPSEGLTTGDLVRVLGRRDPLLVPRPLAKALVGGARSTVGRTTSLSGHARRLEMLWFGQQQVQGWLADKWKPVWGLEEWEKLA